MVNVLGIESSCDDTGAAIINSELQILSNIIISQKNEHEIYQGVVPEIASRSHMKNLKQAVNLCLAEAKMQISDIDVIAATCGPGLIGGVIVGAMFAKSLASVLKKPFIAVNHLEGHVLTARLTHQIPYPYLLLLASGGHCQYVAVLGLGNYKILGQTLDDAIGEAYDKVAKMMNLDFPGGPEIEKKALMGDENRFTFPKPLINSKNCDLSFSGLKTAVRLKIQEIGDLNHQDVCDIAASFQKTVNNIIYKKTKFAINEYERIIYDQGQSLTGSVSPTTSLRGDQSSTTLLRGVKRCGNLRSPGVTSVTPPEIALPITRARNDDDELSKYLVVAGGVAANQALRSLLNQVAEEHSYNFVAPPIKLCTDNAAMIAFAGLERFKNGIMDGVDFKPRARWSLEELYSFLQ